MPSISDEEWKRQHPLRSYRFHPPTGTTRLITLRPHATYKHLRKPELAPEDRKTIQEMRERGKNLDPETLESMIAIFVKGKLARLEGPGQVPNSEGLGSVEVSEPESEPEKRRQDRGVVPGKKAKVIPLPKRHRTPGDTVKYLRTMGVKKSSEVIFRATHRGSWFSHSSKLWVWHEPKSRFGRWFTGGLKGLVDMTGYHMNTVSEGLKDLEAAGVIKKRHHGFPGQGNTIWELALDMRHVNAWKRKP